MTPKEADDFLSRHAPLPADADLTSELIQGFNAVREHIIEQPNRAILAKYMTSFGDGSGMGVYQTSDDALRAHDPEAIEFALRLGLESGRRPALYWCMHFCPQFPSEWQRAYAHKYLSDEDPGIRTWSAMTIERIYEASLDFMAVKYRIGTEQDQDVMEVLRDILGREAK